ncbi:aquaporin [Streptomyces nojiriensis]
MPVPLPRRAAVEGLGTAALVAVVVGSGIQATELTRHVGIRLPANSLATVSGLGLGLGVLIALLGGVSGAHFNPAVTLAACFTGRRTGDGPAPREVAACVPAQVAGAIGGAVPADAMFVTPLVAFSAHERWDGRLWLGEVVATAGLVWLVFGLARAGRANLALLLVISCIGAAYWLTSSTRFTNPAVTIGPAFTDIFAGIAPHLRSALPRRPADRRRRRSRPGRRLLRPPGPSRGDEVVVPRTGQQPATPACSCVESALA